MTSPLLNPLSTIAAYTFLEAVRNRLLWLLVLLWLAVFGIGEFVGALAITETALIQSGLLAAVLRLLAVFITALFVIASTVREFNDKGLELVLSLPLPRSSYFFGKLLGFSVLALLMSLLFSSLLLIYAPVDQVVLWSLSLFCELLLVTAASLLCLFTFNHITPALTAVAAFYVLARSISAMRLMAGGPLVDPDSPAQQFMDTLIDALAYILPGLDRFTPTEWLVYHGGDWSMLLPIAGQTAIYLALLSAAALFDLYRKDL